MNSHKWSLQMPQITANVPEAEKLANVSNLFSQHTKFFGEMK